MPALRLPLILGYACIYESVYLHGRKGHKRNEKSLRGCFDRGLALRGNRQALINHDWARTVAQERDGSLRLFSDRVGLICVVDPNVWAEGGKVVHALQSGACRGMSYDSDDVTRESTLYWDRLVIVVESDLREVSFVLDGENPANNLTGAWLEHDLRQVPVRATRRAAYATVHQRLRANLAELLRSGRLDGMFPQRR